MSRKLILLVTLFVLAPGAYILPQIVEPLYNYGAEGIEKSFYYYQSGLLHKSEEQLINAVENHPNSAASDRAVLLQSKIDLYNGNYNLADGKLTNFMTDRANSPLVAHAALLRSYMAFEKKKYAKAREYFIHARKIADAEFIAREDSVYYVLAHRATFWQAVSYALEGNYEAAQPVFEECWQKYPDGEFSDDAMFALALTAELSKDYEKAIKYYKDISKDYPHSNMVIQARIREVNNLLILREYKEAIEVIEKTKGLIIEIEAGKINETGLEAQSHYGRAAEELLYLRAEAYNLAGNYVHAVDVCDEFRDLYPYSTLSSYVYLSTGYAYLNMKDYDNSIKFYDKVISKEDDESSIYGLARLYRTIALKKKGDLLTAQKELSELTVESDYPYLSQALLELGQIYYESGDFSNSTRILERAVREARNAETLTRSKLLLGASYMEQQRWGKAASAYEDAEKLASKSDPIFMPKKELYLSEARLKQGISQVKDDSYLQAIRPLQAFIGDKNNVEKTDEALFWLAEAFYRSENLKNAAITYQNIIDNYPDSKRREEAIYGLGWSYFRNKKFAKSSGAFNKLIEEYPESKYALEVMARQADAYYITRRYKKAAETYAKAAEMAPNSEEGQYALYQQCHALYRQGAYNEAIETLSKYVKSYGSASFAPDALYMIAWIRFQQGKYAKAIEDYKYMVMAFPRSERVIWAQYGIGDSYYNIGSYEEAINAYQVVVDNYPGDTLAQNALVNIKECLMILGREAEADSITAEYIQVNPYSPFAINQSFEQIQMFYWDGKNKEAVEEYENFLKKYPDNEKTPEALYWMGKSYANMGDPENAIKTFTKLQKGYPASEMAPLSYIDQGLIYKQNNQIKKADSVFLLLEMKYPDDQNIGQAYYERASIKYSIGDTVQALELFRQAAIKFPDIVYGELSNYRLGMYYRDRNEYDSAKYYLGLITLNPNDPEVASEAQYRIAEMWFREKNYETAIAEFKKCQEDYKDYEDWYSLSLLNIGECYEKTGDTDNAKIVYKTLANLRPDDEYGKSAAKRLEMLGE